MSDVHDDIAVRLSEAGLSPEMIAYATELPLQRVKSIVIKRAAPSSALDEKLTEEVGRLAQLALKHAMLILEFGPSEQRMAVIKSVLGGLTRQAAGGQSSDTEEMRVAFETFVQDMKQDLPELSTVITETDIIDVEVVAPPQDADDQDEGPRVPQARP